MQRTNVIRTIAVALVLINTTGCIGMAIGAATDVAIEVGKVPFKVGGAVIDVVNGDEKKNKDSDDKSESE